MISTVSAVPAAVTDGDAVGGGAAADDDAEDGDADVAGGAAAAADDDDGDGDTVGADGEFGDGCGGTAACTSMEASVVSSGPVLKNCKCSSPRDTIRYFPGI